MRISFKVAVLLTVMGGMTSCKHGLNVVSDLDDESQVVEYRMLKGFEEVEVNGSPRVYYTQADSFSVCVKGTERGIDNLISEVSGKTLRLRNRGKISVVNITVAGNEDVAVFVTSPDLTAIRINGSGDFSCSGRIDTDKMSLVLRGSGNVELKDLICDDCNVELIGSGDIDIDRLEARGVVASLIGSGDIDLGLHRVNTTNLSLKGSGDIEASLMEECHIVDCDLRGSGDIKLEGMVNRFSQHKSGSGDIDIDKLAIQK